MAAIHFILQCKGGVGKSLTASLLAQYLRHKGLNVSCFDTDPINATLAGYIELGAEAVDIMDGSDIDPRRFDSLMDRLLNLRDDAHAVVDNGASSFVPLGSYLLETQGIAVLGEQGHDVMLHTVVTGGQAILETLAGMQSLALHFPDIPVAVWLNRYFGDIVLDGKEFQEFKIYAECAASIHAVVELPHRKQSLFGRDLEELFARRQTFASAVASDLPIMTRQRLKTFWRDTVAVLDEARLC